MKKSRILDRLIKEKTELGDILLKTSTDERRLVNARLLDYDSEGCLFMGKKYSESPLESNFYVLKNAVLYIEFGSHLLERTYDLSNVKEKKKNGRRRTN